MAASVGERTGPVGPIRAALRAVSAHLPLLAVVAAYVCVVALSLRAAGLTHLFAPLASFPYLNAAYVVWFAGALIVAACGGRRPRILSVERATGALLIWVATPIFCNAFTGWKRAMWLVVPFTWDPALAHFDMLLHGGDPALRLLSRLPPAVVRAMDVLYVGWFFITMLTIAAHAWAAPSQR